jgi:hypothetical protein
MSRLVRDTASIATGLASAAFCTYAIGLVAVFAIVRGMDSASTVMTARVASFLLVPMSSGVALGAFRPRRPVLLAVVLVAVSLVGTYRSLGASGLPHGWKIVGYFAQTAVVAIAARWASGRGSRGGSWGRIRRAVGLRSDEPDERATEVRCPRISFDSLAG